MINYFNILGIDLETPPELIKKAWIQKCREYHPDKVAHLGEELRQLAATKTLLVNEAYTTLSQEESKKAYLYQLSQAQTISNTPRRRKSDAQPNNLENYLAAPLQFLEIMREITPVRELPSSLYFALDNLNFTLMPSKDEAWVLFSRHPQAFQETQTLTPLWKHTWNQELSAGISQLPGHDTQTRAQALAQLVQFFKRDRMELYLNPGERRGPVYEPNTVLLSCLLDCSIPTAQDEWNQIGMNLFSNHNEFLMKSGWEDRLNRLVPQLFSSIRQRSPDRAQSQLQAAH